MADKKEESGLGNLPPLSDFDSQSSDFDSGGGGEFYSQGEISSDSGLPPLGQGEISSDSGLSPLSDFDSDKGEGSDDPFADLGSPGAGKSGKKGGAKPAAAMDDPFAFSPEGGAAQTEDLVPASDFDTPMFESDFGGDDDEDEDDSVATPAAGFGSKGGGGFGGSVDPFAGHAFDSPIPPGPDSGIDTPLTDSAFGADTPSFGTPAPTQAMQTPMFGDMRPTTPFGGGMDFGGGGSGGGGDTFGGMQAPAARPGAGGVEISGFGFGGAAPAPPMGGMTPPPDFSADTGMDAMSPMGMEPMVGGKKKGGASPVLLLVAAVVAFIIGIAAGGRLPVAQLNPAIGERDSLQTEVTALKTENARIKAAGGSEKNPMDPSKVAEMQTQWGELNAKITEGTAKLATLDTDTQAKQVALEQISQDVSAKNDEYIEVEKLYMNKKNQTAIIEARQNGLVAEVERLTGQVGQLEDANLRRIAVKDALAHNVDRLVIQVKEGIPLTPEKFSHDSRLKEVEALRAKVNEAQWVTPELQNEYSSIYLKEMQIASAQEYFFARLPIKDKNGIRGNKWAECLMKGNWSVYYRTLDGEGIGVYTNIGTAETPIWGFRENLSPALQAEIEQEIIANRADNWETMVKSLAERQLANQEATPFQAAFSSL